MKKFFTLCCCALFGSMLAQAQISITCDGVEVKEGDVLTFYAAEDDFGDYTAGPLMDPNFKNTTDQAFDITVKVKTSDNAKNGGLNWCGITMQCQDIKGGSEERTGTLKPGGFGLNMQLHGVFQKDDFKTYEASVTVYKGMEYVSSFKEVFVYDGKDHTGISTAENVRRMTFDGQAVHYSFGSAAPRTLRVYGIDGQLVRSVALGSQRGSLDLNGLQRGIYVYSLVENGETMKSQKVVVR